MPPDPFADVTQETPREAATPRPWDRFYDDYERGTWCLIPTVTTERETIVRADAPVVASDIRDADARLIVAAVNDYDRLLRVEAAARRLVAFADSGSVISGKRYFHASRLVALREALGETER